VFPSPPDEPSPLACRNPFGGWNFLERRRGIRGSASSLPRSSRKTCSEDEVFAAWYGRLPAGFLASAKASRGLTQFRKLNDPGPCLERMEAGMARLREKRGVLLFQVPPHFGRDQGRLDRFLGVVPAGQRAAVEFRHPSWDVEDTYEVLARCRAAYCVMSGANLPCVLRATADFVYVRLHGPDHQHLYAGSYPEGDLRWADRVGEWQSQGRDVFVYFNNDGHGATPSATPGG